MSKQMLNRAIALIDVVLAEDPNRMEVNSRDHAISRVWGNGR